MEKITVFWFRRDIRLDDNHGFYKALLSGKPVLPVFIFDTEILDPLPKNDARVTFIHKQLEVLNSGLQKVGSGLKVFNAKPLKAFEKLISDFDISTVYTNHDYEPYAIQRDNAVGDFFKNNGIEFKTFKDQVIFEKGEAVKADGNPYTVYTPYMRIWMDRLGENPLEFYPSEEHLDKCFPFHSDLPELKDIGFQKSPVSVPQFDVSQNLVANYSATRNFPAISGTSMIGTYLRFGTLSIRKLVDEVRNHEVTFLKELVWREFFMQILFHFPKVVDTSFKAKYDNIPWENNESNFRKWCEGKTGYPMVDAGMRELNATGYIHNRVRMVVASFLCKHLLIDWRWGEAYFAEKLLDYELASNNGNWQWAAGSGCDAAPYFRVFNPTEQVKKFDKDLKYIKKWVPELDSLNYPQPIVEHKWARERAISTYKKALA